MEEESEISYNAWIYNVLTIVLLCEYVILFIVGIAGNVWVISILIRVFWRSSTWRRSQSLSEHLYVYLAALSTADILVLSVIPFVISQFVIGEWDFGLLACKYFWTVENVNKLLSIAFLTAMSIDRYYAVCHQFKLRFLHQKSTVCLLVLVAIIVVICLCLPVILYSDVQLLTFNTSNISLTNHTEPVLCICAFDELVSDTLLHVFIGYLFVLGYLIPASIITFCYTKLLFFVRSHSFGRRLMRQRTTSYSTNQTDETSDKRSARRKSVVESRSTRLTNHLTNSVKQVVIFYFVCWTPYWIFVLLPLLKTNPARASGPFIVVHMFVHTLPFVNSAANWVFYGLLNRQLVASNRKRSRYCSATPRSEPSGHQKNEGQTINIASNEMKLLSPPQPHVRRLSTSL